MGHHFNKHINSQELSALVPWPVGAQQAAQRLAPELAADAARHVQSCADCARKVAQYRRFIDQLSEIAALGIAPPGADCPKDIDWYEVAAGLWPEMKARQLILHAALCNHCGPLLRAATSLEQDPTPQEEHFLAQLAPPRQPIPEPQAWVSAPQSWTFLRWAVPALLAVMVLAVGIIVSRSELSGARFAEFATTIHRQHAKGSLALDFRSDSQQMLNDWLKTNLPFPLALPASLPVAGEERPYRVEGARLVQVSGKAAVFISYQTQTGPVSLTVAPDSVAAASGGITIKYPKVSFHYRTVGDYKVVTWSQHGRTYALVSQEGSNTQRSCMVCHSAMGDRDLSHTRAPLGEGANAVQQIFQ